MNDPDPLPISPIEALLARIDGTVVTVTVQGSGASDPDDVAEALRKHNRRNGIS